jgi:ABC-2 type transporter
MLSVFGIQLLLAFTITAFGVMMSARIRQMQSVMALSQMLMLPLYFLSGAMFPSSRLPTWLATAWTPGMRAAGAPCFCPFRSHTELDGPPGYGAARRPGGPVPDGSAGFRQ